MKIKTTMSFIAFFAIACSKEDNSDKFQAAILSNVAAARDTAKIPLNDLGTGTFHGQTGGLYPGGLNHPTGTYAADLLATCQSITPMDTFGNPSSTSTGKISFISLGVSTGGQNMKNLRAKTVGNPNTNPKLLLVTCNNGGGTASLNSIMDPNNPYWAHVAQRLKDSKTSFRQVQIIYLESDDSTKNTTFPGRPMAVAQELDSCFRVFKQKFVNVKLVYLLARTTTYDNQKVFNKEPCPYYFGWACKWAIQAQINGVPGTQYKGANAVSPIITWGFYQWATATPRTTDGFKWTRNLMREDGLHANAVGMDTLATRFQKFLLTDTYAKEWYAK